MPKPQWTKTQDGGIVSYSIEHSDLGSPRVITLPDTEKRIELTNCRRLMKDGEIRGWEHRDGRVIYTVWND